jgi:hypothetical protein
MSDFALPAAIPKRIALYKRPLVRWLGLSAVVLAQTKRISLLASCLPEIQAS